MRGLLTIASGKVQVDTRPDGEDVTQIWLLQSVGCDQPWESGAICSSALL